MFHFVLAGDKDNNDDLLHSGSHYFPFEFTLPPKLPSSFKGKHGRLRYYVRLTICTPGGPNHERTSKFAVISSLDLNKEPDALVRYTQLPRYTKGIFYNHSVPLGIHYYHRENRLRGFANNTGADQPAHLPSLISSFVIRVF